MRFSARKKSILNDLAESEATDFASLTFIAGLDPAVDFRGADLRNVEFGACDLAGFDFSEADLRGASFRKAAISGAVFNDAIIEQVRWPRQTQSESPLRPYQREAIKRMMMDLGERGRALALMPTGTGMTRVLEEVIVAIYEKRRPQGGLVLVRSAAERDQLMERLHRRLIRLSIVTIKDTKSIKTLPDLIIHSASKYDYNDPAFLNYINIASHFDALFSTSLDYLRRLINSSRGAFSRSIIAAVDHSLIDGDRSDRRLFLSRARSLFGEPSFVMEVDQALDAGLFHPVRLVSPFPSPQPLPIGKRESYQDTIQALGYLVDKFTQNLTELPLDSVIAICRDERQADMVASLLDERLADYHSWEVARAGNRWTTNRLLQAMGRQGRILVTSLTRHAVEAAKHASCTAILTPLNMTTAQEIAFRSPRSTQSREPLVLDFANAFQGFRQLRYGLGHLN